MPQVVPPKNEFVSPTSLLEQRGGSDAYNRVGQALNWEMTHPQRQVPQEEPRRRRDDDCQTEDSRKRCDEELPVSLPSASLPIRSSNLDGFVNGVRSLLSSVLRDDVGMDRLLRGGSRGVSDELGTAIALFLLLHMSGVNEIKEDESLEREELVALQQQKNRTVKYKNLPKSL